jgi:hypothetical protein
MTIAEAFLYLLEAAEPAQWRDLFIRYRGREDHKVLYNAYIKSQAWRSVRARKLAASGYRCEFCQAEAPLQVHHRTYENLGDEALEDLIAVCSDHHRRLETPNIKDIIAGVYSVLIAWRPDGWEEKVSELLGGGSPFQTIEWLFQNGIDFEIAQGRNAHAETLIQLNRLGCVVNGPGL